MKYTKNDYESFTEKMHSSYPEMFSSPYGGFCIGPGWWPVIEKLCRLIQGHLDWNKSTRESLIKNNPYNRPIPDEIPPVIVGQIKEKFGGLRFYYDGGDDVIDGMVRMAEAWASSSCEECGNFGQSRTGGWIRTLCDEHYGGS